MKKHRRSLVGHALKSLTLWKSRRRLEESRNKRAAFIFEPLESRTLMAADFGPLCTLPLPNEPTPSTMALASEVGEGEGNSMPTLAALQDVVLLGGSPLWIPLDGFDMDGGTLTFTATSSNPNLVTTSVPTGNKSLKMSVEGFGDMKFMLFDHLVPRVTNRIAELVNSGFYDKTGSNQITFHRILNDFVIQAGDPTGTGSGGSSFPDFADQFHVDLQHNRSGLLSMAKTTDDTNDSQFFITEERNETQFVTLTGSPTGGTFTLTYAGQTTGPIAFDNSGNFTTIANGIKSALEGLSRIGSGNVNVTHDPQLNSQNQVVENRRWKVEFVGALAHKEAATLTGGASGLTGGGTKAISVIEGPKSARHLDFNHSIFGILTEGESIRDNISNVATNSSGVPTSPPVISNVDVMVDPENGALMIKAAEGATGEADITVTVTDADGNTFQRTFHVTVQPDSFNGAPFLNEIGPVRGASGSNILLQLAAQDVENNPRFFDAAKPQGESVNYQVSVNNTTGLVTITPPAGFVGTFNVVTGVRGATESDTGDEFDTQLVQVTVAPQAPSGIDLLANSDTGFSTTDNITNDPTLQFQVNGVTNGALVKLFRGDQLLGSATASGTSATIEVNNLGTFGDGVHALTATQTISAIESNASGVLNVTLDTAPPAAFTSTPPTEARVGSALSYDAQNPGEGVAGFVYQLSNAPAGLTINSTTGLVAWTPTAIQVGQQNFGIVAVDAAGNITTQPVSITVSQPVAPKVDVTLTLTNPNGSPLTQLGANQEFILHVFVQDLRQDARGVFSGFVDVLYDANKADAIGPVVFGPSYTTQQVGSTTTDGVIDEAGAFGGSSELGPTKRELFSVRMRASQSGMLTFVADPSDNPQDRPFGLYGQNTAVGFEEIRFGSVSATIDATFQAVADTFNVNEDVQNQSLTPLANDTINPGSGNVLTITGVGTTNNGGMVQVAADGKSIRYTPLANFFGTETFTYTVSNQGGETSTATITVQVQPQNDPPTAVNDTFTVAEDAQNFALDVLANDLFTPDGNETLKVSAVGTGSQGGTIAVGPSGNTVRYTPKLNFVGTETFTYTLSDGNGGTAQATVTVTVNEANDNPIATNDLATVTEETTGNVINVLGNDSFAPDTGETLTVTAVGTASQGGTVTVGTGGANVVYAPAANFQGTETFTYTISDGRGGTATGTVTMTVTNTNDPPTANTDTLTAFKNTAATFNVLANDSSAPDPAETLTIESVTQPAHGTVQITNNGTRITYTPTAGYTGPDSFTYIIKDAGGALSTAATANITVQEFIPSSLSGSVFFDVDNRGDKDDGESAIAGVTITLTGRDVNNAVVSRATKTDHAGNYRFDSLAPGNYTITEMQPAFVMEGKTSVGSQGGNGTVVNRITTQLGQGIDGINNNFGERGRLLKTIKLRDFFSNQSRNYAMIAVDAAGNELWHSTQGKAWRNVSDASFTLQSGGSEMEVQTTNAQNQSRETIISTSNKRLRRLASSGGARLFQLNGGPGNGFASQSSSQASQLSQQSTEQGEGEGASARDAALLAVLSTPTDEERAADTLAHSLSQDRVRKQSRAIDTALTQLFSRSRLAR